MCEITRVQRAKELNFTGQFDNDSLGDFSLKKLVTFCKTNNNVIKKIYYLI